MGFKMKGSPAKTGGIQGTSGHASALKKLAEEQEASALKHWGHSPWGDYDHTIADHAKENIVKPIGKTLKKVVKGGEEPDKKSEKTSETKKGGGTDWEAMHQKAKDKYNRYDDMTTAEYKAEALRQSKSKKETGSYDVSGKEAAGRAESKAAEVAAKTDTKKVDTTKDDKDLVERTSYRGGGKKKEKTKGKFGKTGEVETTTKYRKSGDKKKRVVKIGDKVEGTTKFDKEGKEKKRIIKTKIGGKTYKQKTRTKRDEEGDVTKTKKVTRGGGKRTVVVRDAEGNIVKKKTRKTLKGIVSGIGK